MKDTLPQCIPCVRGAIAAVLGKVQQATSFTGVFQSHSILSHRTSSHPVVSELFSSHLISSHPTTLGNSHNNNNNNNNDNNSRLASSYRSVLSHPIPSRPVPSNPVLLCQSPHHYSQSLLLDHAITHSPAVPPHCHGRWEHPHHGLSRRSLRLWLHL